MDSEPEGQRPAGKHIQFYTEAPVPSGDVTIAPPVDITYAPDLLPDPDRTLTGSDSVLDCGQSWLERNVSVCYWDEQRKADALRERSRYIASTLNSHW